MEMPIKNMDAPSPIYILSTDAEIENPNKIFLGGIPPQATEKMLEEFFSEYGKVKDVRIVTDRVTAESKGYGFVTFDDQENVDHLVSQKAVRMCSKKIRIRRAIRKNGSQFDHINPNVPRRSTVFIPVNQESRPSSSPIPSPTFQIMAYPCYQPLTPPSSPPNHILKPVQGSPPLQQQMKHPPVMVQSNSCSPSEVSYPGFGIQQHQITFPTFQQEFSPYVYIQQQPTHFITQSMHPWNAY